MRIPTILAAMFAALVVFTPAVPAQEKPAAQTEGSPAASVPEIVSVAGEWKGTMRNSKGGTWRMHSMRLEQEGAKVSGKYDIDWWTNRGVTIKRDIPVHGTIEGNILKLAVPSSAFGSIEVRVEGNKAVGTYVSTGGTINEMVLERKK